MTYLFSEPWLLFVAVAALLFVCSGVGYELSKRTHINDVAHHHEQISGLRDGLFVLLGLLLGFTIAMVLPRFDQRQELVVEEANAIRTAMMRAAMLPEPERTKSLELLRQYAGVRKGFGGVDLLTPAALNHNTEQTKELQDELWQQIIEVTQQNQSAVASAYLVSLNEMVSVAEQRLTFLEHRVPREVWIVIIAVGAFQSFVTGYNLKEKFWLSLVITPLVIALVMALIIDIDSPRTGFIRIEQNSMERRVDRASTQQNSSGLPGR
jgi:hypothetical protein